MTLRSALTGLFLLALYPVERAWAAVDPLAIVYSMGSVFPVLGNFSDKWERLSTPVTGFTGILLSIVYQTRPILTLVAVLMILYAGYRMVIGQDETAQEKAKGILTVTLVGLSMAYLMEPFILVFYGSSGEIARGATKKGLIELSNWAVDIIDWTLFIVALLSVLIIIITGIRAIASATNEEGVTKMRRAVMAIAAGILLILLRYVLVKTFGTWKGTGQDSMQLVAAAIGIVQYVLGFLGIVAVAVLIYAGIRYILSMGNEEHATKAKELLIRVVLGLAVIVVSYVLVRFVMGLVVVP